MSRSTDGNDPKIIDALTQGPVDQITHSGGDGKKIKKIVWLVVATFVVLMAIGLVFFFKNDTVAGNHASTTQPSFHLEDFVSGKIPIMAIWAMQTFDHNEVKPQEVEYKIFLDMKSKRDSEGRLHLFPRTTHDDSWFNRNNEVVTAKDGRVWVARKKMVAPHLVKEFQYKLGPGQDHEITSMVISNSPNGKLFYLISKNGDFEPNGDHFSAKEIADQAIDPTGTIGDFQFFGGPGRGLIDIWCETPVKSGDTEIGMHSTNLGLTYLAIGPLGKVAAADILKKER